MGDFIAFLVLIAILGFFIGIPLFWHIFIPVNTNNYVKNKYRHGHSTSYCKEHNSICNQLQKRLVSTDPINDIKNECWICQNSECCLFNKYGSAENVKKYLTERDENLKQAFKEYNEKKEKQQKEYMEKLQRERQEKMLQYDKEYRHGNTLAYCEKHKYDCECLRYKKGRDTSYCKCDRCIIKEQEAYQEYLKATKQ